MKNRKQVVLLVDDDSNVIHGYARSFRKSQFKIYTAKSAEEAMDILKRTTIDVIVTDEYMKAMKGTELLDWVEKFFPDTLRIILTGAPDSDSIEAALEVNAYEYLTKPIDSEILHNIISKALASRV